MFSPSSSVSSANSSSSSPESRYPPYATEKEDDVDHCHRHNRHKQRHRTDSNQRDKSTSSSRGSSYGSSGNSDELSLASTCDEKMRVDLPSDREFVPLETDKEKENVRDQVICMIFDLPESTQFYQDFSCAIASTLAMHGRMYPTSTHVCFYSNVFARERKILIPYESICEIEKTTTMMFQHSIRLAMFDKDEYTFTSFWGNNRDSCYELIVKTRNRVLRELRPTAADASELRRQALSKSSMTLNSQSSVAPPLPLQPNPTAEKDCEEEEEEVGAAIVHDGFTIVANEGDNDMALENEDDDDRTSPATSRRRSMVSDMDSIAPKDISMIQVLEEVFLVSVDTFMQTFYLDNAPFGMDIFGEQTGSTEMTVTPWTTSLEDEKSFGSTRSLQFRVPIDAPIGPKSSQVDVLQCLKESENGVRVVESSTRLVDIPYGDYFSVEDRWTIVPHSSNPNSCKLFIESKARVKSQQTRASVKHTDCAVVFGKSTFWKKTIEARAISDNRAKWEKWVGMAKKFLDVRDLNDSTNCALKSFPASIAPSEKTAPEKTNRNDHGSVARRRSRTKPSHRHRCSTAAAIGARTASVKVFPWVLVLILFLVVLRLQMTLLSIEHYLLDNTELIGDLQKQLSRFQAEGCQ
ncbi:hypothetical protein DD238_003908 [Peronospora effusa]|uniref:VASt domain-containing protein n=1 Tax=Peronospora effusa TaxID=542832 RepID=A0A3M6VQT0_9STRA|nr:hypothetical protein DD238_003908 [Peronospora effusa]